MKKKITLIVIIVLTIIFPLISLRAQETAPPASESPVLDSDLDGLTDEGEINIYRTDPKKPDTDGDGFIDAAEILGKTDPLDPNSNSNMPTGPETDTTVEKETPWAWYITRSAGIVAFILLYLSFFFGFALRLPWMRKIFRFNFLAFHKWVSVQALIFTLLHASALLFDKYLKFSLVDILVPFASEFKPNLVGLGVIGMYLMLLLIITSYLQRHLSPRVWRLLHYTNIFLYIFVFVHALYLGTDFKNPILANTLIIATAILVIMMLLNIREKIKTAVARKRRLNLTVT